MRRVDWQQLRRTARWGSTPATHVAHSKAGNLHWLALGSLHVPFSKKGTSLRQNCGVSVAAVLEAREDAGPDDLQIELTCRSMYSNQPASADAPEST